MDCNEFRMMVQVFVDGEFDELESAEARLHLRGCVECRSLAEHHANMRDHLRDAYTSEAAPADFKLRLMARLRAHAAELDGADAETIGASDAVPLEGPGQGVRSFRRAASAAAAAKTMCATSPADSAKVVTLSFNHEPPGVSDALEEELVESSAEVDPSETSQNYGAVTDADEAALSIAEPDLLARSGVAPPRTWFMGAAAAAVAALVTYAVFSAGSLGEDPQAPVASDEQALVGDEQGRDDFVSPPLKPAAVQARDVRPIVVESVNWHRRNLPPEVVGPSGERVSTWLKPKVDFPVRLPRFERTGRGDVSLLGARLSNVRDKQAAYIVYEVDGNKISVMLIGGNRVVTQPRRARAVARRAHPPIYTANGYNVAVIQDNGITYSVTSELPREDMAQLVDAAFAR